MDGLSFSQLRSLVSCFPPEYRSEWLIWAEEFPNWLPLPELASQILAERVPFDDPPIPFSNSDQRLTRRVSKVLDVTVDMQGRILVTKTIDISLSGIRISHNLPDDVTDPVNVILKVADGPLELICEPLKSNAPGDRSRLKILATRNVEKLRVLLSQWLG